MHNMSCLKLHFSCSICDRKQMQAHPASSQPALRCATAAATFAAAALTLTPAAWLDVHAGWQHLVLGAGCWAPSSRVQAARKCRAARNGVRPGTAASPQCTLTFLDEIDLSELCQRLLSAPPCSSHLAKICQRLAKLPGPTNTAKRSAAAASGSQLKAPELLG